MIPKDIQLMIDKICRSCMCESGDMRNVFEKCLELAEDGLLICDMLMACSEVEVSTGDGLPYLLCSPCELKLRSAYEFKQQCEKSDIALRKLKNGKDAQRNHEEDIVIQPDVHEELFNEEEEDEDDLPLSKRTHGVPSHSDLTCSYCMKIFTSKRSLAVHVRQHIGDGVRYCPVCPSKYTRTNHLMRHMKSHDKPGRKHSCKICGDRFSQTCSLYRHIKVHIDEAEKRSKEDAEQDALIDVKKEKTEAFVKAESEKENDVAAVQTDNQKAEENKDQAENTKSELNDEKLNFNEVLSPNDVHGDDSMDIPLSQFPFSDDDVNDDDDNDEDYNGEDALAKEDAKDEDFVVKEVKEKRPRGRPPSKKDHTLYECKECNKILTTYSGLKVHLRRHTGSDLSKCKHCDKSFTKKSHLNRHLHSHGIVSGKSKIKGDKKIRECEFCDRKFKYKKSFVHHMQVEHGMSDVESDTGEKTEQIEILTNSNESKNNGENGDMSMENNPENSELDDIMEKIENEDMELGGDDELNLKRKMKVHTCHVCNAGFARVNHLSRHMTLHRAVLTHKCDRCEQAFYTEDLLKQHIEQQHINKPYVCTTCNKPFSRGEHLIRHLKLHQEVTNEGQHKCSICESVFSRSDHLARHTKTHLMQDKRHVCIDCGKAFNRLDNLKTHQRTHTGLKDNSKLHLCVYCGKEFNNSSNMIVHMRRHTGERPYKCNECGKGFPRSHDLKCHERTHSGEKPYLCTLCGKSFNKSNKLLRHSRVHTGERPYVCNICSRAFTQSNDLALHMRRHTGARPYACGVCPARFIQSGQLKNHRRQSGHWMETQPDLKGGHRVEPVTSSVEPMPIKFKTFGKNRMVKLEEPQAEPSENQQQPQVHQQLQRLEQQPQLAQLQQPQRILMGIMGNIKLQADGQPLIIDSNKIVELPGGQLGLVTLPTVIQGENGEEIKLKTEIGSYNMNQVEDDMDKHEVVSASNAFHEGETISFSTVQTATTYTSAENFTFQTFN
ncbi:zinc finger protein 91 isoform X3 [Dendroctonus ponderosae]|uniref:Protein krueppel n=1 Tax=Dendroctonus ponderosae TaxID=77166 RepID=A0AAR5P826_DENPD|nr:zinc finger protein 91 isoform X3 [Dendroctonus ponderosae]